MQKMSSRARVSGFTLIEVMVVVVILGILAGLVVVSVAGNTDKARATAARSDLAAISQALDLYKLDNFNYPTTDQGLEALVHAPDGARNFPQGGYLKKLPIDPWGHPYQYFSPGSNGPYDLLSYGADGVEGGEGVGEDIVLE
ncbi:General secretion pathway protein G [gamma proteobacterium HdN1]|nr:General secretion pathway protein G [gamma proteobacterium HdN1]